MKHFAKLIAYHPKLIVIVALILLIPSAIGYVNTFVNYDILSYLPGDLDSVEGENILDKTFKSASTSFLIIDTEMPAKDIAAIKEIISVIKGVSSVAWVDDIADISIPQEALPQAVKDIFYSKNGKYTLMLVQYEYSAVDTVTMDAVNSIRDVMNKQCFLSGMGVIVKDTKELADSQAPIYIAIAIALSLVVMTFCMESWLEPWVLLAALSIAVVYNMGTNVFFGQISYITQCIAAILQLGVTMDYSVFLIDRFEEEKKRFPDKRDAMASAIRGSFVSLSGSSLTTIFGFLALCFMRLTLGRDIGLVMAKGVLFGVLTVTIILPALVIQLDKQLHRARHRSFIPKFDKINAFTIKHKGIFVSAFLILLVPAFIMQNNVSLYYSMDKMLPPELPCVDALNKLKNEFDMATSHFIIVDDSIEDAQLVMMETEINELDGITNSIAYNSFVGSGIPDSMIPDSLKKLAKAGGKQMILVNSSYESATDECNAQLNAINSIVKKYDPDGKVTGEGALYMDLLTVAARDLKITNILSIASIFLLIAIIFKSVSIPAVLVLSIELAILINKAVPFVTGSTISFISPIVIGCVQLGATVDYAILMSTRFREEIRKGKSRKEAVIDAANASDRSIFQSAMVFFAATFGVFVICDISIVKEICLMLARGSLISAGVIIFMLPPILYVLEGFIDRTSLDFSRPRVKKRRGKKGGSQLANSTAEAETVSDGGAV